MAIITPGFPRSKRRMIQITAFVAIRIYNRSSALQGNKGSSDAILGEAVTTVEITYYRPVRHEEAKKTLDPVQLLLIEADYLD
jgi:hypothetical protein